MKKELAVFALAIGLVSAGTAFAREEVTAKKQPVKMTEEQLDKVAGGLVTVVAVDVVDIQNNEILRTVNVPINAAIAVLGAAGAASSNRFFEFRPQ